MSQRSRMNIVALAILLLLAAGTVAAAGTVPLESGPIPADEPDQPAQTTSQESDSITYLSPDAATSRDDYVRTGTDVAAAVESDSQQLRGEFSQHTFDEHRERISGFDDDSALVEDRVAEIEAGLAALEDRHSELLGRYNDGELTTQLFFRELAMITEAAKQHREYGEHLGTTSFSVALDAEVVTVPRPIVDEYVATASGDAEGQTVYVQTTDDGVVLARSGDTHLRHSVLPQERDQEGTDQFAQEPNRIQAAVDRATELYPWATISSIRTLNAGVYLADMNHPDTNVRAYLDGASRNAYSEVQRVESSRVTEMTLSNTSAALDVAVETSQPTGPMRVIVTDVTTSDPVDATVHVNDEVVGSTGSDGSLWVVQPADDFEIRVTTASGDEATLTGP